MTGHWSNFPGPLTSFAPWRSRSTCTTSWSSGLWGPVCPWPHLVLTWSHHRAAASWDHALSFTSDAFSISTYLRFSSILSCSLSPSALPHLHERSCAIFRWLPLGPRSSATTTPALHYLPVGWWQGHVLLMRASTIHFTGQKCFACSAMLPSASSLPMESLTHR